MICIILTTWKQKHFICDPPVPFQHHPVLVHRNRAKGIAVGWSLDHPRYRQVVHSCVFIPAVSSIVFVSSHETHHTAVGAYDGQELVEVPSQADGVCGLGVYRKVTWARNRTHICDLGWQILQDNRWRIYDDIHISENATNRLTHSCFVRCWSWRLDDKLCVQTTTGGLKATSSS